VILDTNIIIDHLRLKSSRDSHLVKLAQKYPKEEFAISSITVQELYEGESTKENRNEQLLLAVIAPLTILPYTFEIAQEAGELMRDNAKLLEFADAAIASTAIVNGKKLVTLNKKDFVNIPSITLANF